MLPYKSVNELNLPNGHKINERDDEIKNKRISVSLKTTNDEAFRELHVS